VIREFVGDLLEKSCAALAAKIRSSIVVCGDRVNSNSEQQQVDLTFELAEILERTENSETFFGLTSSRIEQGNVREPLCEWEPLRLKSTGIQLQDPLG
jgi:hypothetical protein